MTETASNPLALDSTPLPTDWQDVHEMFADIRVFMKDHRGHELIPADDPDVNYSPPRVARLGFVAYRNITPAFAAENIRLMARGEEPVEWDEQSKIWTITLPRIVASWDEAKDPTLAELLRTARGRQQLCLSLKS